MAPPLNFGPVWNMRLFRRVAGVATLAIWIAIPIVFFAKSAGAAAAFMLQGLLFACQYQTIRHITLIMERWETRREKQSPKLPN